MAPDRRSVRRAGALAAVAGALPCAAQPCQPSWSTQFPGGDFDGPVRAYTVFDAGATGGPALYAGGSFTRAGGAHAAGVARWTGTGWEQVGGDFDGDVNALCVHNDGNGPRLYAAGTFRRVGATPATLIARWTGTSWASIGTISGAAVHALLSDGIARLFVGGEFLSTSPSPINQSGVLTYTSGSWSTSLPTSGELDMRVYALASITENSSLVFYAGGRARQFNGTNVARLQFPGGWARPGGSGTLGPDGPVYALAAYGIGANVSMYAAGDFHNAGGSPAERIARWSGSDWLAVGSGVDGPVRTLLAADADGPFGPLPLTLYAGGSFTGAGSVVSPNLVAWNGGAWVPVGGGANDTVLSLGLHRLGTAPALFAGGQFFRAGGLPASHAAAFTGSAWHPLANPAPGNAPAGVVRAVAWFDEDGPGPSPGKAVVGGDFRTVGDEGIAYLGAWDGAAWSALGAGVNGPVAALKVYDDGSGPALAAAGSFTMAGGAPANQVARYRSGAWSALGAGVSGFPLALEAYQPPGQPMNLIVGGALAGNVALSRWDGASWTPMALPLGIQQADALAVFDAGGGSMLYASNQFGGVSRWNGAAWTSVSTGLSTTAYIAAMTRFEGALYAAGVSLFLLSPLDNVAVFRNGSWAPVAGGPSTQVASLAAFDDGSGPALYAGGPFSALAATPALHLARYRAGAWSAPAPILPAASATVLSLAPGDPDGPGPSPPALLVGGSFLTTGGVSSPNLGVLRVCSCYANCDGSTGTSALNVADFVCFQQRFAAGDPYANCDGSTMPPVLNVADFVCFQQRFAAGCP